jgi:hypothetical protein
MGRVSTKGKNHTGKWSNLNLKLQCVHGGYKIRMCNCVH